MLFLFSSQFISRNCITGQDAAGLRRSCVKVYEKEVAARRSKTTGAGYSQSKPLVRTRYCPAEEVPGWKRVWSVEARSRWTHSFPQCRTNGHLYYATKREG